MDWRNGVGKSDDLITFSEVNLLDFMKEDIINPRSKDVTSLAAKKSFLPVCHSICQKVRVDFDLLYKISLQGDYPLFMESVQNELDKNFKNIEKYAHGFAGKYGNGVVFKSDEYAVQQFYHIFTSDLDAIYSFNNSKHFVYTSPTFSVLDMLEETSELGDYDYSEWFDKIPDMFLSLKLKNTYSRFYVKLCNVEEKYVCQNGKESQMQNISVLYFNGKSTRIALSFIVLKERFPIILIRPHGTALPCCNTNGNYDNCITKANLEYVHTSNNQIIVDGCRCTEKKVNEERCYAWLLNPYKVLKIICYVNDMYQNRHTLERKNSKRRAKCKQHEVSINNFYSSGEVVSLQNLYKYERENKPWQGGHHSSPIEHERKAHERVYRNADGSVRKVVQIGETTVNKGNKRDKAVEVRKKPISDLSTGNMELF